MKYFVSLLNLGRYMGIMIEFCSIITKTRGAHGPGWAGFNLVEIQSIFLSRQNSRHRPDPIMA